MAGSVEAVHTMKVETMPFALSDAIGRIRTPLPEGEARAHLDELTKPRGSLGRLEDLAVQMWTIGLPAVRGARLRKAVFVFAADHGIAAEGVSAYPAEVTRQMVLNFLAEGAAVNVLARLHGAEVWVVNAGIAGGLPAHRRLIDRGARAGSRNMLDEAAMSEQELDDALLLGLGCAEGAGAWEMVAVGEMGIGNTSAASALTAALTGHPIATVTGRGTGLEDGAHARKVSVLAAVLERHRGELGSAREILRRVGGLEIAAMTGFMIGLASQGAAVVVDGFISTAAAAFALEFAPAVRPYLFAGHRSSEPGHRLLLAYLGLDPILDLGMRLGEGTGALLAMPVLESALRLYAEMATFASASVAGAGA